jgi:hypothetical protein
MIRWIACPYQRSLRVRRSIIFPVILFMITTGLLYTLIEHYALTTNHINSSLFRSTSLYLNCQLKNETIRAINLASSDYCKIKLKNISCQIDSISNFFPKSLPRFCPIQSIERKNKILFINFNFGFCFSSRRSFW